MGVAIVLAIPVPAAAQAPPDEVAAARAFADSALRFRAALTPLEQRYEDVSRARLPRCFRQLLRRVPERRVDSVLLLPLANFYGEIGRLLGPALTRFSMELHGVQTADPALRAGRTAWRRMRRLFRALAAIAPIDVCAETRRFVAGGFQLTPGIRRRLRLRALIRRDPVHDFDRRVARAQRRLRELGVPPEQAQAFADDPDDSFEGAR